MISGIVGLLATAGIYVYKQFSTLIENFDFFFKGISFKKVSLNTTDVEVEVDFQNLSEISVPIKNILGILYFKADDGKYYKAGNISKPVSFSLKPGNNKTTIPFQISNFDVPWSQISEVAKGEPVNYRFDFSFEVYGKKIKDSVKDSMAIPPLIISTLKALKVLKGTELGCGCNNNLGMISNRFILV